jgi:hypothetical protein
MLSFTEKFASIIKSDERQCEIIESLFLAISTMYQVISWFLYSRCPNTCTLSWKNMLCWYISETCFHYIVYFHSFCTWQRHLKAIKLHHIEDQEAHSTDTTPCLVCELYHLQELDLLHLSLFLLISSTNMTCLLWTHLARFFWQTCSSA